MTVKAIDVLNSLGNLPEKMAHQKAIDDLLRVHAARESGQRRLELYGRATSPTWTHPDVEQMTRKLYRDMKAIDYVHMTQTMLEVERDEESSHPQLALWDES